MLIEILPERIVTADLILGTMHVIAVARNLCAGGQARGAPETPVSRGVWGHVPPENFEI